MKSGQNSAKCSKRFLNLCESNLQMYNYSLSMYLSSNRMDIHSDVLLNLHQKDNITMAAQLMVFINQNTSYKRDLIDGPKFNYYTGNSHAV